MKRRSLVNLLVIHILLLALLLAFPSASWAHGAPPQRAVKQEATKESNVEIAGVDNVIVRGRVVDAKTGEALPCRIHIENRDGIYYAPEGHKAISMPKVNNNGIVHEADVINRGKVWAVIEEGSFAVSLPAIDGYRVEIAHGLEYELPLIALDLDGQSDKVERTFTLKRGINMRERNWMSADTHVHNLMPEGTYRQMRVEALDYVNLMFIGPEHPLFKAGYVTGTPTIVKDGRIVYVSQEVRDAQQGHMTLLGITDPIEPIRVFTGVDRPSSVPWWHEPLNWEVYDHLHAQGGLAFHAHFLYWPGYGSPLTAALGKIDGVEWLTPDMVERNSRTRQDIEVPGYPLLGAGPMWYHMLNCGARIPVVGGTDKMNEKRVVGGGNRTYARVDTWDHQGFLSALDRGETFTTNGPLLDLSANEKPMGSELRFEGKGPFAVKVKTACFTQKSIEYFQIIKDGQVVFDKSVASGQKIVRIEKELHFSESGWIAVRCGSRQRDRDNWENAYTAAHSSPIYVTVNGKKPADKDSANYMTARSQVALEWVKNTARFSSDEYRERAVTSFEKALLFYQEARNRASKD